MSRPSPDDLTAPDRLAQAPFEEPGRTSFAGQSLESLLQKVVRDGVPATIASSAALGRELDEVGTGGPTMYLHRSAVERAEHLAADRFVRTGELPEG